MDGSTSLLVKRAKYSVRKDLKLPGVLTVAVTQLYWTPHDPNQLQTVYVDLKAISGPQKDLLICPGIPIRFNTGLKGWENS